MSKESDSEHRESVRKASEAADKRANDHEKEGAAAREERRVSGELDARRAYDNSEFGRRGGFTR